MLKIKLQKILKRILQSKIFYIVLLFITAIYVFLAYSIERESGYSTEDTEFTGTLKKLVISEDKATFTIENEETLICNFYPEELDTLREKYPLGAKVKIKATLREPSNNTVPNTFNYKEYLYYRNTYYTCTIDDIETQTDKLNILYKVKNAVVNRIMEYDNKDYLYTMIIGDKSLMDEDVLDKYATNGVTHLFAISGMHIGLFSSFLLAILKKLHLGEKKSYVLTVSFIWFYAFLTGVSSSVLRASLLFSLLAIDKILELKIKTIYVLVLTGLILIWANPFILKDIGFIFSFVTTFGLIYNSELLKKHKVLGTSLIAMLFSLPITINNFYEFNLLSILFNIIFVPFVSTIIYPLCLLTFVFSFLEPILSLGITLLEMLNDFSAQLDLFHFVVPKLNTFIFILYYFLLLTLLKKKFWLISTILISIILLNKTKVLFDANYHVEFLDVGQGDSILVRSPHNKEIILIDTGGQISYGASQYYVSENTITYLHSLGIDRIDTLILTHGDTDHLGDALYLLENIEVDKVIINKGEINKKEQRIIDAGYDVSYNYDGALDIKFLNNIIYDNENDNSIVTRLKIYDYEILLMGDASVEVEKDILEKYDLKGVDILKVGHHGSNTSSSEEFIDEINPKYSVITVGKNNRYNHPNDEVLKNLEKTTIYRTDMHGSIMFTVTDSKLEIETCAP